MSEQNETQTLDIKTKREMMRVASLVSYFALGCSVWVAASLLERDSGTELSALLIDWAPALELKVIFFVMLYLTIRYVLNYYRKTYPELDQE